MRVLETPRLLLAPVTEPMSQDALETVYRIYVAEMDGGSLTMDTLEQEIQFDLHLAHNTLGQHFGRPAILIKATSRRIGHCVFLPRLCTPAELSPVIARSAPALGSSIEAEIGWAISDQHRNQGYATEAAQALVAYGFAELGLARLVAFTDKANAASLKVMQKLGMRIGHCRGTDEMIGVIEQDVSR
jgi:[ribosomal protein S5]-alanine N-acetyltransferase